MPDPTGIAMLDRIVKARMTDVTDLIGQDDLERLYMGSGGVLRVLFRLLRTVAGRARGAQSLPIPSAIIEAALASERSGYLAVTAEALPWLNRIRETRSLDLLPQEALDSLGRYFQAIAIVQYANGEKWYSIHPLLRERVRQAAEVPPSA